MKVKYIPLIISIFVFFIFSFFPESCSTESQSEFVEIKKLEILTGQFEVENGFTYILEDESYLIRIEVTFPKDYRKGIKIVSNLIGSIWVKELEKRSRSSELEFDLTVSRDTVTIDIEGRAPKALVKIEGSAATSQDDKLIVGEKEFELFKIFVQEIPVRLKGEETDQFVLSSHTIIDTKKKILEARSALEILRNSTNSDMKIVADIIERIESLLIAADECLKEGAPEQALQVANQCILLASSNILEDQARMLNYIIADTEIDFSESSRLIYEVIDEIERSSETENFSECIDHSENARNRLDMARDCYTKTVNNEISRFEFSLLEVALLIIMLTTVLLLAMFYVIFQKTKKRAFENGIREGTKKAAREKLSPRDIILGREEEGEE